MNPVTHTLKAPYEVGPFCQCNCEIEFDYSPENSTQDSLVKILEGRFHYNGHWICLDREAAPNIHPDIDDHCLKFAETLERPDSYRDKEDLAYDEMKEREVVHDQAA